MALVVPDTGPAWTEQLSLLTGQIRAGSRPIGDGDLGHLAAALELAQVAIAGRTRWPRHLPALTTRHNAYGTTGTPIALRNVYG